MGVGEYLVTNSVNNIIKTCALGSCVAVIIYDFKLKVAGLIHIALPDSVIDPSKARRMPGYYADTGLPIFIEEMKKYGAVKKNIWIKMIGGANTVRASQPFDIGKRNIIAVKKYLWRNSMGSISDDLGGSIGRTVSVFVDTGEVLISSGNNKWNI